MIQGGRNIMAKHTRIASTIASHPVKAEGAVDVFYTDGRMNDPSHIRDKDMTLDRVDEGFYFTIFASSDLSYENDDNFQEKKDSLEEISELAKKENKYSIDDLINDMAENAISLTGRLSIKNPNRRSPYYAGFLVKDSEMAAVTMGDGIAYLYRNDALYPLTHDDFPMEAKDHHGNTVENFDIYAAGRAGTIRYSNISQLQVDDCIILCTKNVMETIGQEGMLKILDEAYDQEETAELVRHEMEKQDEDQAFQFFMSFIEEIIPISRMRREKGSTGYFKAVNEDSKNVMTDETTRFDRSQMPSYSARAAGLIKDEVEEVESDEVLDLAQEEAMDKKHFMPSEVEADAKRKDIDNEDGIISASGISSGFSSGLSSDRADDFADENDDDVDYDERDDERDAEGSSEDSTEASYKDFKEDSADDQVEVVPPSPWAEGASELIDQDDDDYKTDDIKGRASLLAGDEDDDQVEETGNNEKGGRILLTILILILLAITMLAVAYLIKNNKTDPTPSSSTTTESTGSTSSETSQEETTTVQTTTTESTTEATTAPTTTREGHGPMLEGKEGGYYPSTYLIKSGDTFYAILQNIYYNYNIADAGYDVQNELINRFVEANPETITGSLADNNVMIYADTTINVPDPSDLLEAKEVKE